MDAIAHSASASVTVTAHDIVFQDEELHYQSKKNASQQQVIEKVKYKFQQLEKIIVLEFHSDS